jgi:thiol-disulfide isomerase/thioredoxin
VKLTDGKQLLLSGYRGKVVVMTFIHTTCPHCQGTSQLMKLFQRQYGPRGFQAIAVAFESQAKMLVPYFVKRLGLTYPVGYDNRDVVAEYARLSGRILLPIVVFIDRAGMIRAQYNGQDSFFLNEEKNIRTTIEKLLNEQTEKRTSSPIR